MAKNIIFLFSLPRSGSTLLQRILSAHSQISTVSEPWLLLPFVYATRANGTFAEYNHRLSNVAVNDFINKLPQGEDDYFRELAGFTKKLYSRVSDKQALFFLDKTPRYYFIIPEIKKMFPEAKFIFLFRNPLEVFSSIINIWCNNKLLFHKNYADLFLGPLHLAEGYRMLSDQSIRINFESMVRSPEASVKTVLEYLELEYEPEMLDHFKETTIEGKMGDPGRFESRRIDYKPLEKWKNTFNTPFRKLYARRYLNYLGTDTLRVSGYELDDLEKQVKDIQSSGFGGMMDPVHLFFTVLFRTGESSIFARKIRRKYQTGEPFMFHG